MHRRKQEFEVWPQLLQPWVKLTLIAKIVLVVTQANLLEEACSKVKQPLSEFLGHCIEQSVRGVAKPEHAKVHLLKRIRREVSPQEEFPGVEHCLRWFSFTSGGNDEDDQSSHGQLHDWVFVESHDFGPQFPSDSFPSDFLCCILGCVGLCPI